MSKTFVLAPGRLTLEDLQEALEAAHALLRAQCPAMGREHYLAPEIEKATELVRDGSLGRIWRRLGDLPALWIAV